MCLSARLARLVAEYGHRDACRQPLIKSYQS